jgi:hypothetical protein
MSNKKISQMPLVKSEDVKPLYNSDEIIEKLAIAVNGMREMVKDRIYVNSTQHMDLELMYSLAIALRDKTKFRM